MTYLNVESKQSQGVLFAFKPEKFDSFTDFGPVILRKDANRYLCLRIQCGTNKVSLWKRSPNNSAPLEQVKTMKTSGGNQKIFGTDNASYSYRFETKQWYWCRFEYEEAENELRFRIWEDGEDEPSVWAMKFFANTSFGWERGVPGLMSFDTTNFAVKVRNFYYYRSVNEVQYSNGANVDSFDAYPIEDQFNRFGVGGFGSVQGEDLFWYGNVADTPLTNNHGRVGSFTVDATGERCAVIDFDKAYDHLGGYWGFLGNTVGDNMTVLSTFSTLAEDNNLFVRFGVRGQEGRVNGTLTGRGYAVQIRCDGSRSRIRLMRRTQFSDDDWQEMTDPEFITIVPNTRYNVRLVLTQDGDNWTIKARVWQFGAAEPRTWNLTKSGTDGLSIEKGAPFLNTSLERSAQVNDRHLVRFYRFVARRRFDEDEDHEDDETGDDELEFLDAYRVTGVGEDEVTVEMSYNFSGNVAPKQTVTYWESGSPNTTKISKVIIGDSDASNKTRTIKFRLHNLSSNTDYLLEAVVVGRKNTTIRKRISFSTSYSGIIVQKSVVTDITTDSFYVSTPFEIIGEKVTKTELFTGTISSGTKNQLVVTGAGWVTDQWKGYACEFDGQVVIIKENNSTTLEFKEPALAAPTAGNTYKLYKLSVPTQQEEETFERVKRNLKARLYVRQEGTLNEREIASVQITRKQGPALSGTHVYFYATQLLYDTVHYWRVVVENADGVSWDNSTTWQETGEITTEGERVEMYLINEALGIPADSPIEVEPSNTSAKVTIHYRWDVLNNVNFTLTYRPTGESEDRWIRLGAKQVFKRKILIQTQKSWFIVLNGLTPGLQYDVRVKVDHPVGVKGFDIPPVFKTKFTTRAGNSETHPRAKHYLFKVYQPKGVNSWKYLKTLTNATQPEFGFHENGGVSDMTLKLPEPLSAMDNEEYDFGNRVDCWVVDHSSNGIGRNLIRDSDMNLGSWVLSPKWSIDPRGGPDDSAALLVNTTNAGGAEDYALSEYITLTNRSVADIDYEVTISLGNLFDDFEDDIVKKQVNYRDIAREIRNKVVGLYPTENEKAFKKQADEQLSELLDNQSGPLHQAGKTGKFRLLEGAQLRVSVKTLNAAREIQENGKQIGSPVFFREVLDFDSVPYVLQLAARVAKGNLTVQMEYYDVESPLSGQRFQNVVVSEEFATTDDPTWHIVKLEFTPPLGARRMRVRLTSQGGTKAWVDKVQILPQELLIYRGVIESVRGSVDSNGEMIDIEVLGLASKLTDFYIPFKQWVDRQPKRDQPKLVDPYMFDADDPPALFGNLSEKAIRPRETYLGEQKQSAIVFPDITDGRLITRVYYDGDANRSAECDLFYTRNTKAAFPAADVAPVTSFNSGDFVYVGLEMPLKEEKDGEGETMLTLRLNERVKVVGKGSNTKDGIHWYKVQTLNRSNNKTGFTKGEYLRASTSETTYLWTKIDSKGRSHPDHSTGNLFEKYDWGWTEKKADKDGNEQNNTEYRVSARRDKKYFEFELKTDALNTRNNFKFVARMTDKDGVIDQNNLRVPDTNTINTAERLLFPELSLSSPFTATTDLRNDEERRTFSPPTDPSVMARELLDLAKQEDESFPINYAEGSIQNTGNIAQYTFRDMQLRNAIDKVREMCPPGWHWFVDASGKFYFRGPQHTMTHRLRLGEEILTYNVEKTVKNIKNVIIVRGRQDADASEPDGSGSISLTVRDELSVRKLGARYLYLRDSNIKDQITASIFANGRLEENKRPERQGSVMVVDEKELNNITTLLKGYNVESIQPGDYIIIEDGTSKSDSKSYWDRSIYNESYWDSGETDYFDNLIQIKSIRYRGDHVELQLSQRPPSAVSDFAKLVRWQQMQQNSEQD